MERTRRRDHDSREDDQDQEDPPPSSTATVVVTVPSSSSSSAAAAAAAAAQQPAAALQLQKEHMFDKIVTPSDVGKLNRLVIPKQHAEKYFPLDTTVNEKGLLLNFEDRTGKAWRFRYSYWNSSQSYVMTKGWSRFVKEKRLDAGDTVSFGRAVDDRDRLFIDWKRRPDINHHGDTIPHHHRHQIPRINPLPLPPPMGYNYTYQNYHHQQQQQQQHQQYLYHHHHHQQHHRHPMMSFSRSVGPWAGTLLVPPTPAPTGAGVHQCRSQNYESDNNVGGGGAQYLVFRSAGATTTTTPASGGGGGRDAAEMGMPMVLDSVPVVQSQAAAKRVRLFGVNLDCPDVDSSSSSNDRSVSVANKGKGKEKEELSLDLYM